MLYQVLDLQVGQDQIYYLPDHNTTINGYIKSIEKLPDGQWGLVLQETQKHDEKFHELDSSMTCNYCGIAAERVNGIAEKQPCPQRR